MIDGCLLLTPCSVSDVRGDTQLSVFEGDIRDGEFLRKSCRGASIVFHVASIIDVKDAVEYGEIHGVNVKGEARKPNILFSMYNEVNYVDCD